MSRIYLSILILSIVYAILLSIIYNTVWIIVMLFSALIYGSLGIIVAVRKLYYLASASPHIALLAVTLAIPTSYLLIHGFEFVYALLYGLLMIYIVGYMIYRGIGTDIATAIMVGATSSLSVLAIYYVLTHYPLEYSLSTLIIGDPLLATWTDAYIVVLIAIITLALIILTYHEQLSLGVDRGSAVLLGLNVRLYDLLVYTLIGIGVIGLIKIIGYILEHVLILLPPSIAMIKARSSDEAFILSILTAITASLIGLHLGILLNISPTGLTGTILLIYYIIVFIRWRK